MWELQNKTKEKKNNLIRIKRESNKLENKQHTMDKSKIVLEKTISVAYQIKCGSISL